MEKYGLMWHGWWFIGRIMREVTCVYKQKAKVNGLVHQVPVPNPIRTLMAAYVAEVRHRQPLIGAEIGDFVLVFCPVPFRKRGKSGRNADATFTTKML